MTSPIIPYSSHNVPNSKAMLSISVWAQEQQSVDDCQGHEMVPVTSECTTLLGRGSGSGGFQTVASARALCQPTSCGSEYFYNQRPRVWNLIGTERSLIEVSVGLRRKQAKSNSVDRL